MAICPNCKKQYPDVIGHCPYCEVPQSQQLYQSNPFPYQGQFNPYANMQYQQPQQKKNNTAAILAIVVPCIAVFLFVVLPAISGYNKRKIEVGQAEKKAVSESSIFEETRLEVSTVSAQNEISAEGTNTTTSQPLIILEAGEENEYSETLTLNAGTEFEENLIVYFLPAGQYLAKNITGNFAQINVYSRETHLTDEGWEEPAEIIFVKLLSNDESVEFEIKEDQYIEIHEPDRFELTLIK